MKNSKKQTAKIDNNKNLLSILTPTNINAYNIELNETLANKNCLSNLNKRKINYSIESFKILKSEYCTLYYYIELKNDSNPNRIINVNNLMLSDNNTLNDILNNTFVKSFLSNNMKNDKLLLNDEISKFCLRFFDKKNDIQKYSENDFNKLLNLINQFLTTTKKINFEKFSNYKLLLPFQIYINPTNFKSDKTNRLTVTDEKLLFTFIQKCMLSERENFNEKLKQTTKNKSLKPAKK